MLGQVRPLAHRGILSVSQGASTRHVWKIAKASWTTTQPRLVHSGTPEPARRGRSCWPSRSACLSRPAFAAGLAVMVHTQCVDASQPSQQRNRETGKHAQPAFPCVGRQGTGTGRSQPLSELRRRTVSGRWPPQAGRQWPLQALQGPRGRESTEGSTGALPTRWRGGWSEEDYGRGRTAPPRHRLRAPPACQRRHAWVARCPGGVSRGCLVDAL
jgi:hypothetical protein